MGQRRRFFPIRLVLSLVLMTAACGPGREEDNLKQLLPHMEPLSPEAALHSFQVAEGFQLQLVAAEPQVADPIAMAFDAQGRIYVAEMRGYPYDPPPGDGPAGRVRLLEDSDGDGYFEKSTIFADRIHWPSGVACWKGGIFLAAPPDILYLKDSDGDGVADVRKIVYTGFGIDKSEDIMNNLKWGLDNYIYGTGSYNGGMVRSAGSPESEPFSMLGHDFRFHPETGRFERIEGTSGDFGNCFDDWGNRFSANAGRPVIHAVLPELYLSRNPDWIVSRLSNNAVFQSDRRVYSISDPEPWRVVRQRFWSRWVDTNHEMRSSRFSARELAPQGYLTGGAGVEIYRGNVYPDSFQGNAFSAEPAGNLVLRMTLFPDGPTFVAQRAYAGREFIASRDNWFRPVNLVNGPDGCLYLMDMYREVIEDPSAIPEDILEHIDYYSGQDRGRIYRIVPVGFQLPDRPQLNRAGAAQLVRELTHPNAWWRETAQRLLLERREVTTVGLLREVLSRSDLPQARVHALWTLEGLGQLDERSLLQALDDFHPEVRRNGVRLAESRLQIWEQTRRKTHQLAADQDARVLFQTALALSSEESSAGSIEALAQIVRGGLTDYWVRTAVMLAVSDGAYALFDLLTRDRSFLGEAGASVVLQELAELIAYQDRESEILSVLRRSRTPGLVPQSLAIVSGIADGMAGSSRSLGDLLQLEGSFRETLHVVFEQAHQVAMDSQLNVEKRVQAIRLLGHAPGSMAVPVLSQSLSARESNPVQLASVRALSRQTEVQVGELLVSRWDGFSPAVRSEVTEVLFSRSKHLLPLLAALEAGSISGSHLSPQRRQFLLEHDDLTIRERAEAVLDEWGDKDRHQVVEHYRRALNLAADRQRGKGVFDSNCASCHRLNGEGHGVGPDLETVRHRSGEELLLDILDPNSKVQSNYVNYRVDTTDGRILTGIISEETASGLTLRRGEGMEDVISRSQIDGLRSMDLSLMPEALEEQIDLQQMADLIDYIRYSSFVLRD